MRFVIEGNPVAKGRPKMGKWGVYTPRKTKDAEAHIRLSVKRSEQCPKKPTSLPVAVAIDFYMEMPASWSNNKKMDMDGEVHTQRPDVDNLMKLTLDSLNGVLYQSDSQIYKITATKQWAKKGRTVLSVDTRDV